MVFKLPQIHHRYIEQSMFECICSKSMVNMSKFGHQTRIRQDGYTKCTTLWVHKSEIVVCTRILRSPANMSTKISSTYWQIYFLDILVSIPRHIGLLAHSVIPRHIGSVLEYFKNSSTYWQVTQSLTLIKYESIEKCLF